MLNQLSHHPGSPIMLIYKKKFGNQHDQHQTAMLRSFTFSGDGPNVISVSKVCCYLSLPNACSTQRQPDIWVMIYIVVWSSKSLLCYAGKFHTYPSWGGGVIPRVMSLHTRYPEIHFSSFLSLVLLPHSLIPRGSFSQFIQPKRQRLLSYLVPLQCSPSV